MKMKSFVLIRVYIAGKMPTRKQEKSKQKEIEMYAKLFKISIWQNCNLFTVYFFFVE